MTKILPANITVSDEDQVRLNAAFAQLLTEGLLWREHESDRRAYNDLVRWQTLARAQLHSKGWELVQHQSLQLFQVVHKKGKHRRHLKRDTGLALLLCRLLYAEIVPGLTPYPVLTIADLIQYATDLGLQLDWPTALPELEALKLIQAAGGKTLRPTQADQLIALLPALTVVVPDSAIEAFGKPQPGVP